MGLWKRYCHGGKFTAAILLSWFNDFAGAVIDDVVVSWALLAGRLPSAWEFRRASLFGSVIYTGISVWLSPVGNKVGNLVLSTNLYFMHENIIGHAFGFFLFRSFKCLVIYIYIIWFAQCWSQTKKKEKKKKRHFSIGEWINVLLISPFIICS